ncbi:MAG: hypothetical protein ACPG5P_07805, partial [Saprospiraceae bacterium]
MNRLLLLFFACMMISSQSVYAQCSGSSLTSASLDFSSGGPFSFTDIGGGDITNGGSRTAGPFSFDIWDETTGTATPGGANDITFDF